MGLIATLPDGPLDVLGDVHGEREALDALLATLGYDADGRHAAGRRLVFVGDLCDRGPDSPGTIRRVAALVAAGRAHAILGNHEMNLLRGARKHGNHWFFGATEDPRHPEFGRCAAADDRERAAIVAFLAGLPLALERPDLRVVHAAWIDGAIAVLRAFDGDALAAYERFERLATDEAHERRLEAAHAAAFATLGDGLYDAERDPGPRPALGAYDEHYQMSNPVRVLTSGVERAVERPFFAAGKWRFVDRVRWWDRYDGPPVLFGHYWRWWDPAAHAELSKGEPQLFHDDPVGPAMAEHHAAFCVDFSVGARFKERHAGRTAPFHGRLAALRWPERELVFDGPPPR